MEAVKYIARLNHYIWSYPHTPRECVVLWVEIVHVPQRYHAILLWTTSTRHSWLLPFWDMAVKLLSCLLQASRCVPYRGRLTLRPSFHVGQGGRASWDFHAVHKNPHLGQYDMNFNMYCKSYWTWWHIGAINAYCYRFWMIYWLTDTYCCTLAMTYWLFNTYCCARAKTYWSTNTYCCA